MAHYWRKAQIYNGKVSCYGDGGDCLIITRKPSLSAFCAPGPKSSHYDEELRRIAKELNGVLEHAAQSGARKGKILRFVRTPDGLAVTWGVDAKSDPEAMRAIKGGKAKELSKASRATFRRLLDY